MALTKKLPFGILGCLVCLLSMPSIAEAQISEVRFGVFDHNVNIHAKNGGKEKGPDIQAQMVFESPSWLEWAYGPHPLIVGSLNTHGETSFLGAGMEWSVPLGEQFELQPFIGVVYHNGDFLDNPYEPADGSMHTWFNDEKLALGSRDLFWIGFNLERKLSDEWAIVFHFEHLSHGQILGSGKNQGLDNFGLMIARKF